MEQHVKIVAILNIVLGGLGVLIALFVLLLFGGLAAFTGSNPGEPNAAGEATILRIVGGFVFLVISVFAVPTVIAGIGMLKFREWARILGIVVSAFHLLNIPLGTALGVYGIWALSKDETRVLFKQRSLAMPVAMAR